MDFKPMNRRKFLQLGGVTLGSCAAGSQRLDHRLFHGNGTGRN